MAKDIELDLSGLIRELNASIEEIADAGRESLQDVMDDWKAESIDLAPVDKSTLRRGIHYKTKQLKGGLVGEIQSTAIEQSGKWGRFNYAYYIHEVRGDNFKGRTPGTIGRYLDVPAEKHEKEWLRRIELAIRDRFHNHGF